MAERDRRSGSGRFELCSTWSRAASTISPYWTPEGHAVTQAMHDKQLSKCLTVAVSIEPPDSTCPKRWIRPRGESISSPHSA